MARIPFLRNSTQLNLTVEEDLKREGHIYAARQRRSLSQLFSDWLRTQIDADKKADPERYVDDEALARLGELETQTKGGS